MGTVSSSVDNSVKSSVHSIANKFVFMPPQATGNPYPEYITQATIKSSHNNNIEVIMCMPPKPINKCIIFSHGNASCNEDSCDLLKDWANKFNVVTISYDYQGYSNSQGIPGEQNCYDDIEAVINFIKKKFQHIALNNIFLIGQSLGTGITMDYVSKHAWTGTVILISPYKSILSIVADDDSALMFSSARNDMFVTKKKTHQITCPVKIFHGVDDTLINYTHSQSLFDALPNKRFKPTFIKQCGHNDILYKIPINIMYEILHHNIS